MDHRIMIYILPIRRLIPSFFASCEGCTIADYRKRCICHFSLLDLKREECHDHDDDDDEYPTTQQYVYSGVNEIRIFVITYSDHAMLILSQAANNVVGNSPTCFISVQ